MKNNTMTPIKLKNRLEKDLNIKFEKCIDHSNGLDYIYYEYEGNYINLSPFNTYQVGEYSESIEGNLDYEDFKQFFIEETPSLKHLLRDKKLEEILNSI